MTAGSYFPNGNRKITAVDANDIVQRIHDGDDSRVVAEQYGLNAAYVSQIAHGKVRKLDTIELRNELKGA